MAVRTTGTVIFLRWCVCSSGQNQWVSLRQLFYSFCPGEALGETGILAHLTLARERVFSSKPYPYDTLVTLSLTAKHQDRKRRGVFFIPFIISQFLPFSRCNDYTAHFAPLLCSLRRFYGRKEREQCDWLYNFNNGNALSQSFASSVELCSRFDWN